MFIAWRKTRCGENQHDRLSVPCKVEQHLKRETNIGWCECCKGSISYVGDICRHQTFLHKRSGWERKDCFASRRLKVTWEKTLWRCYFQGQICQLKARALADCGYTARSSILWVSPPWRWFTQCANVVKENSQCVSAEDFSAAGVARP